MIMTKGQRVPKDHFDLADWQAKTTTQWQPFFVQKMKDLQGQTKLEHLSKVPSG